MGSSNNVITPKPPPHPTLGNFVISEMEHVNIYQWTKFEVSSFTCSPKRIQKFIHSAHGPHHALFWEYFLIHKNTEKIELLWAGLRYSSDAQLGSSGLLVQTGGESPSASDHVRVLGVTSSFDLSLDKPVANVCSSGFYWLCQLRRLGDDRYSAFDVRMDDRYSRRRTVGVRTGQRRWVSADLRVDLRLMRHAEML